MLTSVEGEFADPAVPLLSYDLSGAPDRQAFLAATRQLLAQLIPSDEIAWNGIDRSSGEAEIVGAPAFMEPQVAELLVELDDHPMVNSYLRPRRPGDTDPRRMSDVVSHRDLVRTRAYADLLHPMGAENQLTILTSLSPGAAGSAWTFARHTGDFTDKEVDLATRLQPVLVALDRCWEALVGPPEPTDEEPWGLTPRELEVMTLVAKGLTATACARALRIAPGTLRKHLQNVYAKLGCSDRLVAVDMLRSAGLLQPPVTVPTDISIPRQR